MDARLARAIPVFRQRRATDCGAACLRSVAEYFGRRASIARIRGYASTDREGTSVLGLVTAAERLGLAARGVRATFESLAHIPNPAIAHMVLKETQHHYVVVYGFAPEHVLVMDPGDGRLREWSHDEFRAVWSGVLVLLAPPAADPLVRG